MENNNESPPSPPDPPTSGVGLNNEEIQRDTPSNDDSRWRLIMEQQNRNFLALIEAMKAQPAKKDIQLPEFNPEKENVDSRAWVTTADMCIVNPDLQGPELMMALSRALKGQASAWLSQVSFHGMTWTNFKDLFTARYECAETAAAFLINLHNGRPKDNECLASYAASLMSSLTSKWKDLTVEQIAVSTILAHISQFENRIQRLSFTQDITTRNRMQQELKAISFMKRKPTSQSDHTHDAKRPRQNTEASHVKCYVCGKVGHKAIHCRLRKGSTHQDIRSKTASGDIPPKKTSTAPSVTCFGCGTVGHYAKNCPRGRSASAESNTSNATGSSQEKRVNVCVVNTPMGTLRQAVSSAPADDDAPYLKVNTLKNFFNVGEKKAIFCEGKHLSGDLEWYDPSGEKIPQKSTKTKRIYVEHRPPPTEGPTFLPLMIKSLSLDDSGVYTCKAGDLNASINIFVGEKVVIKELEQNYYAEEGQSIELSCLAKGTPTPEIQWYKDNIVEPLVTNEKYRITYKQKASTSILRINDLTHMDPGTYRCRATQETISHFAEKTCHLRVRHKPVIMNSYSEKEVYAILDEWKNITCKAVAFPAPTFTWSRHVGNYDEELKSDDEEFQITSVSTKETGTSSVLTLHITNETLDMQYKCTVENPKGRQNFVFHVSLGNKPEPPTAVTMVSATVNNITFEVSCDNCTFFKEDGLAPRPENLPVLGYVFQWVPHKHGYTNPYWVNGTTYTFELSENNGTTFTINNLDKDTQYDVRVATRNLAGLSDWYDVEGDIKTTDGAAALAKSIVLFIFALVVCLTY